MSAPVKSGSGSEAAYLAAVMASLEGLSPGALRWAVGRFGGVNAAWMAPAPAWSEYPRLKPRAVASLRSGRTRQAVERLRRKVEKAGAFVITPWDDPPGRYPANLLAMDGPPPVLYVRGELKPEDRYAVAIVGSRRADPNGVLASTQMAADLAGRGFTIVSGLAAGIDGAAHRSAIHAHGRTIGVLGCGFGVVYPPQHSELYEQVAQSGALLSEYPPGVAPDRFRFALRNRIIAGLSLAVLVVEARERSGAISTALMANDLSRAVLAVPGDIVRSTTLGSNRLIADGAEFCIEPSQVQQAALNTLATLTGRRTEPPSPPERRLAHREEPAARDRSQPGPVPPDLQQLFSLLRKGPVGFEELCVEMRAPVSRILSWVTELEALGRVRRLPGGRLRGLD